MAFSSPSDLPWSRVWDAARMCARAFYDDPLSVHFIPNDAQRSRRLPHFFEFLLNYGLRFGRVLVISERLEGLVIILRGKYATMSTMRSLRSGAPAMRRRLGPENTGRVRAMGAFSERIHHKHAPGDHLYLPLLCVEPDRQGQGFARRLLESVLDEARRLKLECYLETHRESNQGLYQHFGFELAEECTMPGTDLKQWSMLRLALD